ncbi:hypothetical protein L6164_016175 [Bauhinia variegata]|uniref:Uncharacterized protein n=1 Tax=Bauhinia variegata TaxID=167791 RepID=A0ACB9NNS0_BAUVA|nr:hypothetical protein L6164_016175 [Bauhinia variegata]
MGEQPISSSCGRLSSMLENAKPYLLMVAMQFGSAGMYIITMSSFNRGLSRYVFIVYRNAIAALILAPFAFFVERKVRPEMTFPVFWRIMLLGFLEVVMDQGFAFLGMVHTSATYTSAVLNALPSITFLMAVILRIERVRIKEVWSKAKVIGTVISFGGCVLMALYKGPVLNIFGSSYGNGHNHSTSTDSSSTRDWIVGTVYLFISCVAFSTFYVLQSMVLKIYPAPMSLSCLLCFFGAAQAVGIAVGIEHHSQAWALGWDSRLFAPLYAGIVTTGIMFYVQGEVMRSRGPVFVTAFNPLRMIIVAILALAILGEKLYLGSVIGSVVVVIGLYAVIWGKSREFHGQDCTTETKTEMEIADAQELKQKLPVIIQMPLTAADTHVKIQTLQIITKPCPPGATSV